jgi:hypothetical protein
MRTDVIAVPTRRGVPQIAGELTVRFPVSSRAERLLLILRSRALQRLHGLRRTVATGRKPAS